MSKFTIQPNDVIIHHGVNHGLISALIAFTNPGDEILIPETGYPIFTDTAPSMKIKPVSYPLLPNQNYSIDLEKTQELLTEKTKFMFIINPTNPMGTVYTKKHMEEIINFADKN
jgi:aspartate/methionine/tyrosine aminotransferase